MIVIYSTDVRFGAHVAAELRASKPKLKARYVDPRYFHPSEPEYAELVVLAEPVADYAEPMVAIIREAYGEVMSVDAEVSIEDAVSKIRARAYASQEVLVEPEQPTLDLTEQSETTAHVDPAAVRKRGQRRQSTDAE